jgi:hypothetical protein
VSILSDIFGPSRQEIWQQLCDEIGAEYIDGGFWRGDKVQASHGPWTVTLDTYTESQGQHSHTYTRLRAPFTNADGFRFTIYRQGIFSGIGKFLGMQDVEVGDPVFDRDFVIKGSDEDRLRRLFGNAQLRNLITLQPEIHFTVKEDEGFFGPSFPEDTDELCFRVPGVIKDIDRLKLLFDLFAETLEQLCRIGSASKRSPKVQL